MATQPVLSGSDLERTTIHKLRTTILPFVLLLFFVAYLDRINIGFAALTMNKDLGITSQQYGFLAGIFFIGYFIFEIPSNLLLQRVGARVWIARILLSWGVVAVLTGFAENIFQLYVLRFLLGVAEAGFFPGIILYFTYWFPRREQARAVACFMAANPVGNLVGAPLSGLILDHAHWAGMSSWRWLLVLEGVPAVVGGVLTYLLLPNGPEEATFLDAEEKAWLSEELARDRKLLGGVREMSAPEALRHRRVWHLAAIYFTMIVASYAMVFWMPQAIQSLASGRSNTAVGILVMIPVRADRDALGVAELRSYAGEASPYGPSGNHRSPCVACSGRGGKRGAADFCGSLGVARSRHLQRLWPILVVPARVPKWDLGGMCDRTDQFDR